MSETNGTEVPVVEVKEIGDMSDREIAEETLYWLRQAGTALVQMQSGPMGRMMTNMFNKASK